MGDIDDGRINFPHKNFLNHIKKELILKKGDLLLNRTNSLDLVGKVGLIEKNIQNVSFASYLIKLSLKSINSKSFFNYFLNSHNYLSNARCNSIKTANQANLSLSKYLQFFVSIPSQNEQINISNILDQKTSQIDKKIKLLQEKRESYEELKKTLINETVCRGLNKDVELKEANANWVGKIPSHWNVERLKNIFEERVEKNLNVDGTPVTTNILSVIKDVGVINHKEKGNVGNKMSEDITGYKIVHP